MDDHKEIREFFASRRARVSPEQAGLPAYGNHRRVKGLRREEVAMLAGVSVDYYVRLERGNLSGASDSVLDGVARALHLDDAEHQYLYDLARRAPVPAAARRRAPAKRLRPALQHMLDAISDAPALIHNHRQDLVAANHLARALYAPLLADPRRPANIARFIYLDPAAGAFLPDWDKAADDVAAMLRGEAARNPYDKDLSDLIGELSTRSEIFRKRWAAQNVRQHRIGPKKFQHPAVGVLELNVETMSLASSPEFTLVIYTAVPDTPSADALRPLSTWAATQDEPDDPQQRLA
ncbi:helix-turn-helix transcriptional regulator [Streptomyces sp. MI02-2A]|uniref:helix-turn-helix domain-containing protein n=1 Tax=Streptomyces sp. MI02-2A TaxID=3028688 RepID=UPI0029A0FC8E|nr:helix-turn-helix transcriptional regulator [Streptomyces sp. MI02-2A]MDX3264979.1 helix-turn-helix transcriptional regulator [Streptomyces sp. MI02-2A]